jgi:hypothetical protein
MAAIETLIQEILRTPATDATPRTSKGLAWIAAPASNTEHSWEWYDSSYDLQTGLEVTEHDVPASLCAAVFQSARRHDRSAHH